MIEAQTHALKVELMLYRICLESDERASALNKLYTRFFERLLKDATRIRVPDYYLTDFVELQLFLTNVKQRYYGTGFAPEHFRSYVRLLETLLSDTYSGANPHAKAKFMELLLALNAAEGGRVVGDLRALLPGKDQLSAFVRSVLSFYSAVEFMTDYGAGGGSKYRYRYFISKFLVKALEQADYADALRGALGSKSLSDFVAHMLTDLNYFLEEAFEKIAELRALPPRPPAEPPGSAEATLRETTTQYLKFGRSYLRLFERLAEICPQVFDDEQWAFKVARVLNFYAAKMCARSYRGLRLENVRALGLKPLEFIRQLVALYALLSGSERVKREIIADERSYDRAALLDIGSTAYHRKLLPEDTIARFEELLLELQTLETERDDLKHLTGDAPDEFSCALTYEFMSHPVRLPSSGTVVELSAIKQHITLNGEYDPFNRQKLTLADVQEVPELRARIEAWLAEKKAEYRAQLRAKKVLADVRADDYSDTEDNGGADDESVGGFGSTFK